jgi:HTH-type transcriptional regulator/antitoxin HigA
VATIKPVRTSADYERALARIDDLMGAEEGSPDGEELDVLVDLVELYESRSLPVLPPDPIAAIEFRMDQQGLAPRDLIPFLGSRSRVSEVLTGSRAITMPMARALYEHLGIPADVLLQAPHDPSSNLLSSIDARKFPLRAMANRGWIPGGRDLRERADELIAGLIRRAGGPEVAAAAAFYRKNDHRRLNARTDDYALRAWCWQVMATANERPSCVAYEAGVVTPKLLSDVARLSRLEDGPRQAQSFLAQHGVALEVLRHLPRTHLDGAVLRLGNGSPVIGLTLRYDRIDNFWFCLLHELAHVGRHFDDDSDGFFFDDLKLEEQEWRSEDSREVEADEWAQEALIPQAIWETSRARLAPSALTVINLAQSLKIHPAMVAGRVRHERRNYRLLSQFVGSGQIRRHFESSA